MFVNGFTSGCVNAAGTASIMKTASDGNLKSLKKPVKTGWTRKQSVKKYSAYIYKIEKELSIDMSDAAFLMRHLADVHAQVGTEAARLSKFNRRRVITQRELHNAAVRALQDKIA